MWPMRYFLVIWLCVCYFGALGVTFVEEIPSTTHNSALPTLKEHDKTSVAKLRQSLLTTTEVLLREEIHYPDLTKAIKDYKQQLEEIIQTNLDTTELREDIHTENGRALGTLWAAMCVDDMLRTKRFSQGVYHAIQDMLASTKEQIHIVYAGTGPFATLILPSILRLSPSQVRFTFMELNPQTYEMMVHMISALGLDDFDIKTLMVDASLYQFDSNNNVDIFISETMQAGLNKEQQVSIFINLMRQAKPHTVFIPESIDLVLLHFLTQNEHTRLSTVFSVNKDQFHDILDSPHDDYDEINFEKVITHIPQKHIPENSWISLSTEITVYKGYTLTSGQSGLTIRLYMASLEPNNSEEGVDIHTQYVISDHPTLEWTVSPRGI